MTRKFQRIPVRSEQLRFPRLEVRDSKVEDAARFQRPESAFQNKLGLVHVFEYMEACDHIEEVILQRCVQDVAGENVRAGGLSRCFGLRLRELDSEEFPARLVETPEKAPGITTDVEDSSARAIVLQAVDEGAPVLGG